MSDKVKFTLVVPDNNVDGESNIRAKQLAPSESGNSYPHASEVNIPSKMSINSNSDLERMEWYRELIEWLVEAGHPPQTVIHLMQEEGCSEQQARTLLHDIQTTQFYENQNTFPSAPASPAAGSSDSSIAQPHLPNLIQVTSSPPHPPLLTRNGWSVRVAPPVAVNSDDPLAIEMRNAAFFKELVKMERIRKEEEIANLSLEEQQNQLLEESRLKQHIEFKLKHNMLLGGVFVGQARAVSLRSLYRNKQHMLAHGQRHDEVDGDETKHWQSQGFDKGPDQGTSTLDRIYRALNKIFGAGAGGLDSIPGTPLSGNITPQTLP